MFVVARVHCCFGCRYGLEKIYNEYQKVYKTTQQDKQRRAKQQERAARDRQRERSAEYRAKQRKLEDEERKRGADIRADREKAREERERQATKRKSDTALMDTDAILQSLPTSYTSLASRKKKKDGDD